MLCKVAVSTHVVNEQSDNFIQELFLKNLYEDFKLKLNQSLTPELKANVDERVEAFQNVQRHHEEDVHRVRRKRAATEVGMYSLSLKFI